MPITCRRSPVDQRRRNRGSTPAAQRHDHLRPPICFFNASTVSLTKWPASSPGDSRNIDKKVPDDLFAFDR